MKPDNTKTIVNFANSILKHFSAPTWHETIPEVDQVLEGHKKVVVLLFDGLGRYIVEQHLKEKGFIRSHYLTTMEATFPPTTVASTTGFISAKFPIETGWMSWNQYFEDYGCDIEVFRNTRKRDGSLIRDRKHSILFEKCPFVSIFEQIQKANPAVSTFDVRINSVSADGPKTLREANKVINKNLRAKEESFTYFYWPYPDGFIHHFGVHKWQVHWMIKGIERFVKKLVKQNPDTLFLTFADHGLIDVEYVDICEHDDLYSLLSQGPSFEVRTIDFFVKPENKATFAEIFNKYYGEHFELMDRESVFKDELFGKGTPNPLAYKFVGDFVAIAKDKYCMYASKEIDPSKLRLHKGHHAGGTADEMDINISAYNC